MKSPHSPAFPDPPVQRLLIRWSLRSFRPIPIVVLTRNAGVEIALPCTVFLIGVFLSLLTVLHDFQTLCSGKPTDGHYNGEKLIKTLQGIQTLLGILTARLATDRSACLSSSALSQKGRFEALVHLVRSCAHGRGEYLTKSRGSLVVWGALVAYWLYSRTRGVRSRSCSQGSGGGGS